MHNLDELIKSSKSLGKFFKGASALIELADSIEADKAAHEALRLSVAALQEELVAQEAKVLAAKDAAREATEKAKADILAAEEDVTLRRQQLIDGFQQYKKAEADQVKESVEKLKDAQREAEKQFALVLAEVSKARDERDKLNQEIESILAKLRH